MDQLCISQWLTCGRIFIIIIIFYYYKYCQGFRTPFSQKDRKIITFEFYQKKCYMITQDGNKQEKRRESV